jgi:hypothetical protein
VDAIKLPYDLVLELVRMAIDRQLLRNLGTRDSGSALDLKYAFTDEGTALDGRCPGTDALYRARAGHPSRSLPPR